MNVSISHNGYLSPRRVDLFSEISKELDHAMNNIFGHDFFAGLSKKGKGYPLMDAIRTDKELILQYTVPGVKREDLDVEISEDEQGRLLMVSGLLHDDYVSADHNYQIRELSSQEFRRVIRLPADLNKDDPILSLNDGILSIKFGLVTQKTDQNNKVKKLRIQE